jgi:hypothetical protein
MSSLIYVMSVTFAVALPSPFERGYLLEWVIVPSLYPLPLEGLSCPHLSIEKPPYF